VPPKPLLRVVWFDRPEVRLTEIAEDRVALPV